MNTDSVTGTRVRGIVAATLLLLAGCAWARDRADDPYDGTTPGYAVYSEQELADLVAPVALYPDDLLAIVLPATTFPLQLVQAADFLDRVQAQPDLRPGPEWDDSVVALLNYPEVLEMLNRDLGWARRLGEAVAAQEPGVVDAIQRFRDRAWQAGNLRSDDRQVVRREDGVITIALADPQVVHVPYYEPTRVVYYSPVPVYHYHPRRYALYYYPYPAGHSFSSGFFWGVTSAYAIAWRSHHLRVHHHAYRGHPYYGRADYRHHFYRRGPVVAHGRPLLRSPAARARAPGYRHHPAPGALRPGVQRHGPALAHARPPLRGPGARAPAYRYQPAPGALRPGVQRHGPALAHARPPLHGPGARAPAPAYRREPAPQARLPAVQRRGPPVADGRPQLRNPRRAAPAVQQPRRAAAAPRAERPRPGRAQSAAAAPRGPVAGRPVPQARRPAVTQRATPPARRAVPPRRPAGGNVADGRRGRMQQMSAGPLAMADRGVAPARRAAASDGGRRAGDTAGARRAAPATATAPPARERRAAAPATRGAGPSPRREATAVGGGRGAGAGGRARAAPGAAPPRAAAAPASRRPASDARRRPPAKAAAPRPAFSMATVKAAHSRIDRDP